MPEVVAGLFSGTSMLHKLVLEVDKLYYQLQLDRHILYRELVLKFEFY